MKLGNNSNSALQESIKQQQEFKQREKSYSRIQDMLAESNVNIQALERFVALINSDQEAKEAIRQLQKAATSITGVNSILTQREYREHIRAFQRVLAQEQSNGEVVMLEGKKRTLFEGLKNASDSILPIQPKLTSELFNEINNHLAFLDGKQTARSTSENDKEKRNLNLTMQYNRLLISLQAIETQSGDTLTLNKGKFQEDMAKFIQTFKATLEHEYQAMQHDLNYKELSNSEFRTRALTQITDKARFEELRSRLERQEKIEKAKRTRLLQAYVYGEEGDKRLETIQDILPIFEEIFSDEIALIDSMKQQSIPEQEILSQILSDPRYTNFFQYTQHDSDLTFWRAFEQALLEEKQSRKE
ncbi:MAG TPA: hypothetical protein VLG12_05715 [Candidatus Saccharimonadales bacterium]|nr:hypothetical protein [Candidatus Saccharimonadales bacterium]